MSDKKVGRPTKCTAELIKQAEKYRDGDWRAIGDSIPSIASLACYLGVRRETIQVWAKDAKHVKFSNIVESVLALQERELINMGLRKEFDAGMSKLLLTKHGYSDKVQQDNISTDHSMSPTRIEIVAPDGDSTD
jgi:hypothetical protein